MLILGIVHKTVLAPVDMLGIIIIGRDQSVLRVGLRAAEGIIFFSEGNAVFAWLNAHTVVVNEVALRAVSATILIALHAVVRALSALVGFSIKELAIIARSPGDAGSIVPEHILTAGAFLSIDHETISHALNALTREGVASQAKITAGGASLTIEELSSVAHRNINALAVNFVGATSAEAPAIVVKAEGLSAPCARVLPVAFVAPVHASLALLAVEELADLAGYAPVAVVEGAVPAAATIVVLSGVAVLALGALASFIVTISAVVGAHHTVTVSVLPLAGVAGRLEALEVGAVLAGSAVAEAASGGVAVRASRAFVPFLAIEAVHATLSAAARPAVVVGAFLATLSAHTVNDGTAFAVTHAVVHFHFGSLALEAIAAAGA